jgi:hypothetical protein
MDRENYPEYNATLKLQDLLKKDRLEKFISHLKQNKQFIIKSSSGKKHAVYLKNMDVLLKLQNLFTSIPNNKNAKNEINSLKFSVYSGTKKNITFNISLSNIVKIKEFGGRDPTRIERGQIGSIQSQLDNIKNNNELKCVPIFLGDDVYDIVSVSKPNSNSVKADIVFFDLNGIAVAWASLKKGNSPKDFQQWSGVSSRSGSQISNSSETQYFIKYLKENYKDGVRNSVMKSITDNNLKKYAVFGKNALNSQNSEENVNMVIQGNITLSRNGNYYVINASNVFTKNNMPTNSYEPTFYARPDTRRNDGSIPKTRIGIFPKGYRPEGKVEEIK